MKYTGRDSVFIPHRKLELCFSACLLSTTWMEPQIKASDFGCAGQTAPQEGREGLGIRGDTIFVIFPLCTTAMDQREKITIQEDVIEPYILSSNYQNILNLLFKNCNCFYANSTNKILGCFYSMFRDIIHLNCEGPSFQFCSIWLN